jgi:hypothetical protein
MVKVNMHSQKKLKTEVSPFKELSNAAKTILDALDTDMDQDIPVMSIINSSLKIHFHLEIPSRFLILIWLK